MHSCLNTILSYFCLLLPTIPCDLATYSFKKNMTTYDDLYTPQSSYSKIYRRGEPTSLWSLCEPM